jgi:hypothetical protein
MGEVVITTAHQANGAVLLLISLLLAAWVRRSAPTSVTATDSTLQLHSA